MFSSKGNGQCFAFQHLQLNSHKLKETRMSKERGNESFVNNNNNNALEYCDVLIGPCARVVTKDILYPT